MYKGSDLYYDSSHPCQQRTSGALNWEAWIKDSRDGEFYRVVKMPDNNWWLAQNVKLASYGGSTVGSKIDGCTANECGRAYTCDQIQASYASGTSGSSGNVQGICPPGWLLPVRSNYSTLGSKIGNAATICAALRAYDSANKPINDTYGWAGRIAIANGEMAYWTTSYSNDAGREDGLVIDWPNAGSYDTGNAGDPGSLATVRCFRTL
jgi:uncharacterized protein (TIGR02145 family)